MNIIIVCQDIYNKKHIKMSEEGKDKYYKDLQYYVDKVKELKEWKNSSDDKETIYYLQKEIEKLLAKMKELVSKKGGDK
jgi:hypothetical protein